ncbi:hypothetical protein [Bacillus sp. AK128]
MFMAYFIVVSIFLIGIVMAKTIMDGVVEADRRYLDDFEEKM